MGGLIPDHLLRAFLFISIWFNVHGVDYGGRISEILKEFANQGLGTADMQEYVDKSVNFKQQTIDSTDAEEIAQSMSEKLGYLSKLLQELQEELEIEGSSSRSPYGSCCDVVPKGESAIHGDGVNMDDWCLLKDSEATQDNEEYYLPSSQLATFKNIYQRAGKGIKYVYFGSEDGVLYTYPAVKLDKCQHSYDPRFTSWYVETATPEPKDVVIIIDKSTSMSDSSQVDRKTLLDIAKEAAITVTDTLNPNDRIGVLQFSDDTETLLNIEDCYKTSLAKANTRNKDTFRRLIAYITSNGVSRNYNKAFEKAFAYFRNAELEDEGGSNRDKVILFLTGGEPTDAGAPNSVYNTFSHLNGQLGNQVVIVPYLLSTATNKVAEEILSNLSRQVHANLTLGPVKPVEFTKVEEHDNLRSEMAAYYNVFKTSTGTTEPTFTAPAVDTFGSKTIQMAMCLPVTRFGNLKGGVACMDLLVDDILSDVTYFRKGEAAYAFVIDRHARILSHPLLANPGVLSSKPVIIDMGSLEFGDEIEEVRNSMISGGSGAKQMTSRAVTARGGLGTEGVDSQRVDSTYYWHPVQLGGFSVCLVTRDDKTYQKVHWDDAYPSEFAYHKNRITPNPRDICRYFKRVASKDGGMVKFAPKAFAHPFDYILGEEQQSDVIKYEKYFTGSSHSDDDFREEVRDHVAFSYKFEELMESREAYGDYAVWRYIGTEAGVIRVYPGTEIATIYDPTLRSWYLRGLSSPTTFTVSTPYIDAWGAGLVITLSKAIMGKEDEIIGVMGLDFTLPYFYNLLAQDTADCTENQCLVIDRSGFVILDYSWFEPGSEEIEYIEGIHISAVEPEIAYDLISTDPIMQSYKCINIEALQDQTFWKLTSLAFDDGVRTRSWYELHEIDDTNIYLLIKTGRPGDSQSCYCPSVQNNIEKCSTNEKTCFCPCFTETDVYDPCSGTYSITLNGDPPCSPPIPSVDSSSITDSEASILGELDSCRDYKCGERDSREQCLSVASCTWCEGGTEMFCGAVGECHLGPSVEESTESTANTTTGALATWIIAVAAAAGLVLIIAVVVTIICVVKRKHPKNMSRSDTIPNTYADLQHGRDGHSNQGYKSEDDNEDDIYHRLRESKIDYENTRNQDNDDTRPQSVNNPPRKCQPPPATSKTLPPNIQGLPSSIPDAIPLSPYTGAQPNHGTSLADHEGAHIGSSQQPHIEDTYLKASAVPSKSDQPITASGEDVYLKAANVPKPDAQ